MSDNCVLALAILRWLLSIAESVIFLVLGVKRIEFYKLTPFEFFYTGPMWHLMVALAVLIGIHVTIFLARLMTCSYSCTYYCNMFCNCCCHQQDTLPISQNQNETQPPNHSVPVFSPVLLGIEAITLACGIILITLLLIEKPASLTFPLLQILLSLLILVGFLMLKCLAGCIVGCRSAGSVLADGMRVMG
jgi:hypothetical protein